MATGEVLLSEPAVEESTRGRDDSSFGEVIEDVGAPPVRPPSATSPAWRGRRRPLLLLALALVVAGLWWFTVGGEGGTSRLGSEAAENQQAGDGVTADGRRVDGSASRLLDGGAIDETQPASGSSEAGVGTGSTAATAEPERTTGPADGRDPATGTPPGSGDPSGAADDLESQDDPDPGVDEPDATPTTAPPVPSTTLDTIDPTSSTSAPTTTGPPSPTTTSVPTTTTTGPPTTPVPTTPVPTTTTTEPTTTQPPSTPAPQPCQLVVSRVADLKEEPRGGSRTLTVGAPGTYSVSARSGTLWYQVVANGEQGWMRSNGNRVPTGDCDSLL